MDRVDRLIISLLQENARTSLSEISSKVSLSVSAVSERIRKLESSGLIKCYTAILDPHAFKRDFCVLLFVKLTGPAFPQELQDFVRSRSEIVECYTLAGSYDLGIKVLTESQTTFEAFVNDLRALPHIVTVDCQMVLSVFKTDYSF
ncbi:MAG: Lrp/AsnC family transcriptional regulator [Firmicutes bacterium]|nr:Lrp/AsnC family transcriptional regulator [Bacillota bacterium]